MGIKQWRNATRDSANFEPATTESIATDPVMQAPTHTVRLGAGAPRKPIVDPLRNPPSPAAPGRHASTAIAPRFHDGIGTFDRLGQRPRHDALSTSKAWRLRGVAFIAVCLLAIAGRGNAQIEPAPPPPAPDDASQGTVIGAQEYADKLRVHEQVTPLSSDLFGESISLYNGQTEFSNVDIDIPGNNALPVQLRRHFAVVPQKRGAVAQPFGGFANWDIDVPYISGVFDGHFKWDIPEAGSSNRCSSFFSPGVMGDFDAMEVGSGIKAHIPGKGDRELMYLSSASDANGVRPTDGQTYYWTTSSFDMLSCVASTANGYNGQGFVMRSTDGTRYTFNWGAERAMPILRRGDQRIGRVRVYLLATKVEDSHGNWVKYVYDANTIGWTNAGRLLRIESSDGRKIGLSWNAGNIASATENPDSPSASRTWTYSYDTYSLDNRARLSSVSLPDGSRWGYAYQNDLYVDYANWDGTYDYRCVPAEQPVSSFSLSITHPAGATGTFSFEMTRQYRNGVPRPSACQNPGIDPSGYRLLYSNYADVYSIRQKTVSGSGTQTASWTYASANGHIGLINSVEVPCLSCVPDNKVVTVTNPDQSTTQYTFGILYGLNEGKLLETDRFDAPTQAGRNLLRSEVFTPIRAGGLFGLTHGNVQDPTTQQIWAQESADTLQQGVHFKRTNSSFDAFARPLVTSLSSTLPQDHGPTTRTETTVYKDFPALWLMGQVETIKESSTGKYKIRNVYHPEGDLWKVYEFGNPTPSRTLEYRTDGTLQSSADGAGHLTTYGTFKRGIPSSIQFADGTAKIAVIDDLANIVSVIDELLFTTSYGHDAMGRTTSITYPGGDSPPSNPTSITYARSTGDTVLSGPHWTRTMQTGNGYHVTYYDARWRPYLTKEYDGAIEAATRRYIKHQFDHDNRETFVSYPSASANPATGVRTTYDALGRSVRKVQDSELGQLVTVVDYPASSFQKNVTDARGNLTSTFYQAFDEPSEDYPVFIAMPERTNVEIQRDVFGKTRSLTRSGTYEDAASYIAASRYYVYDGYERLCKTIEPESGATIQDYDAAGNIAWLTKGSTLTTQVCDRASVPTGDRNIYGYDALNRVTSITYPGGTSPLFNQYYDDGQLHVTSQGGSSWTYDYNHRRLLERETLNFDGQTFEIDWVHDKNGFVSGLIYPDELAVNFQPNALGQPTTAGTFASGVTYHPSGAIQAFTYGNGLRHELTQNARQLPLRSRDYMTGYTVLDLDYDYDASANVTSITDNKSPPGLGNETRSMSYDGLDRLKTVAAPGMWDGTALYGYDPLDNLRHSKLGVRDCQHDYSAATNRLTRISGSDCPTLTYGYDSLGHGNVVQRGARTFTYDRADRLISTAATSGGSESYDYDGHGRRIRIVRAGNAKTYQVYSKDGQLLHELAADGTATDFVYLGGSLVARVGGADTLPDVPDPPAAPLVSPAVSTSGLYTVSWVVPDGATSMVLLESTNGAAAIPVDPQPPSGATSWAPLSARTSGTYVYSLRACNVSGCSEPGSAATVWVVRSPGGLTWSPIPLPPSTPYTVRWDAVSTATSYKLEEKINGVWNQVYYGTEPQSTRAGRPAGSYPYRVRACRGTPCSDYSVPITVVVQADNCNPAAPASISVSPTSTTTGNYTVSWPASASACTSTYQLQELFNHTQWQPVPLSDAQNQQHQWSPNPPKDISGTYTYRVAACGGTQCSSYTVGAEVTVSLPVNLIVPTGLQACRLDRDGVPTSQCAAAGSILTLLATQQGVSYRVSWNAVESATTYQYQLQERTGCNQNWATDSPTTVTVAYFGANGQPGDCDWLEHRYVVRACAGANCSAWTNPSITIRIERTPVSPNAITATYYHTDALHSPVVQSDANGIAIERTRNLYEPYGATLTPPLQGPGYTGHVTDALTGLSYMQQRYYDPLSTRLLMPDPAQSNVENGWNFNRYAYAANNPYKFTDPDGRIIETAWDIANVALDVASLAANLSAGNLAGAAVDVAGLVVDGAATAVPGIPGGAGTAIKAYRAAGLAREAKVAERLAEAAPRAKVQSQRLLRDANGKKAIDPVTKKGRIVDHAVIQDGKATTYETTSIGASKRAQMDKEQRILDNGGKYIRDKDTRELVPVNGRSQIIREP